MIITNDMLREAMKSSEYQEWNDRVWDVIEGAFTLLCFCVYAMCILVAFAN